MDNYVSSPWHDFSSPSTTKDACLPPSSTAPTAYPAEKTIAKKTRNNCPSHFEDCWLCCELAKPKETFRTGSIVQESPDDKDASLDHVCLTVTPVLLLPNLLLLLCQWTKCQQSIIHIRNCQQNKKTQTLKGNCQGMLDDTPQLFPTLCDSSLFQKLPERLHHTPSLHLCKDTGIIIFLQLHVFL